MTWRRSAPSTLPGMNWRSAPGCPRLPGGAIAPGEQRALARDGRCAAVCARTVNRDYLWCWTQWKRFVALPSTMCLRMHNHQADACSRGLLLHHAHALWGCSGVSKGPGEV